MQQTIVPFVRAGSSSPGSSVARDYWDLLKISMSGFSSSPPCRGLPAQLRSLQVPCPDTRDRKKVNRSLAWLLFFFLVTLEERDFVEGLLLCDLDLLRISCGHKRDERVIFRDVEEVPDIFSIPFLLPGNPA